MQRRTLLSTVGVGIAMVAGCSSSDEPAGDGTETTTSGNGTGTDTGTATGTDTETDSPTPANREASALVGEVVSDDDFAMVVRDVSRTESLGQYTEAESGNTFVVVRLAVKNSHQEEAIDFSSLWQTRLKDASNHVYDQALLATTDHPMPSGELVAGEVARGDVVYEVPKDAEGLTLQFDFSVTTFDRVTVDLGQQAGTVGDLSQSLRVPIHAPGEAVADNDIEVTLHGHRATESLGTYTEAESGNEFVVTDVSVTNESDEELAVSSLLQMVLKDGRGLAYDVSLVATSALDQAFSEGSEIAPGDTRRGEIGYELPKGSSPLYWTFDFSLLGSGDKTFWQLR